MVLKWTKTKTKEKESEKSAKFPHGSLCSGDDFSRELRRNRSEGVQPVNANNSFVIASVQTSISYPHFIHFTFIQWTM